MTNYKLSHILHIAQEWFRQLFWEFDFWFESEISRIKIVGNRVYFDLIECSKNWEVIAKARWIVFDKNIWDKFLKEIKVSDFEEIKWCKLLLNWKLNFHQDFWIAIYINAISSEYVLGQIKKNLDSIRQDLIKLWIYEKNKILQPWFPVFDIAVVSSSTSEWLKDFVTVLENSRYKFNISFYESAVHWNEAKVQVYDKLKEIYSDIKVGKKIDFVVILRWWGGSHGIIWQNDINIAKWVCYMQVPVIVAVWHTSDKHILDDVCWYSAKTPTDAAYALVNRVDDYLDSAYQYFASINEICTQKLNLIKYNTQFLYNQIDLAIKSKIEDIKFKLQTYFDNINSISPDHLSKYWYGIVSDEKWNYIKKSDLDALKTWDKLQIKLYDKTITVEIQTLV